MAVPKKKNSYSKRKKKIVSYYLKNCSHKNYLMCTKCKKAKKINTFCIECIEPE